MRKPGKDDSVFYTKGPKPYSPTPCKVFPYKFGNFNGKQKPNSENKYYKELQDRLGVSKIKLICLTQDKINEEREKNIILKEEKSKNYEDPMCNFPKTDLLYKKYPPLATKVQKVISKKKKNNNKEEHRHKNKKEDKKENSYMVRYYTKSQNGTTQLKNRFGDILVSSSNKVSFFEKK